MKILKTSEKIYDSRHEMFEAESFEKYLNSYILSFKYIKVNNNFCNKVIVNKIKIVCNKLLTLQERALIFGKMIYNV